jgi:hypothetical protein
MKQRLLYQHSENSFDYISKQFELHNKLKVKEGDIVPMSHQKAFLFTDQPKGEITKRKKELIIIEETEKAKELGKLKARIELGIKL